MEVSARCPSCQTDLVVDETGFRCLSCGFTQAFRKTDEPQTRRIGQSERSFVNDFYQKDMELEGGRFRLIRLLGTGGMGEVWLAHDAKLDEDVAVKLLPQSFRKDEEAMEHLRRETRRSRKLSHEHLVRVYDLHEDKDVVFISMEFVDGTNLLTRQRKRPDKVFTWNDLADLTRQLCQVLDYAHREHVIHRDLKPGNLMLDSRGRLKLADFGIAATLSDTMNHVSFHFPGSGTPLYMSPQQMEGLLPRNTDDIYSLGATLYHLLTGKPPFYTGDVRFQLRHTEAVSLRSRLDEFGFENTVPPEVDEAIVRCLAKQPKDRPQTAGELAQILGLTETKPESLPEPEPEPERKPGVPSRIIQWFGRSFQPIFSWERLRTKWVGGLIAASLSILLGLILMTPGGSSISRLSFDLLSAFHPPTVPDEAVLVYLDDLSHDILEQPKNAPWDRRLHARLVDQLAEMNPKLLVFDIVFDEPAPNDPQADAELEGAFERMGSILLCGEVSTTVNALGVLTETNAPLERFTKHGKGYGFSWLAIDPDYTIRRHPPSGEGGRSLSHAAAEAIGKDLPPANRTRWMRYYGPPDTLPDFSYHQVLSNDVPVEYIRDKVVFIGTHKSTGFSGSAKDSFQTSLSWMNDRLAFGAEIHATTFLNLARRDWLYRLPIPMHLLVVVIGGGLFGYFMSVLRLVPAMMLGATAAVATLASTGWLLHAHATWTPWLAFLLQLGFAFGIGLVVNAIRSQFENKVLERSLSIHLPPQRVKQILKNPQQIRPGTEKREVTIMFTDIVGFSTIADRTVSDRLYNRLNAYFTDLIACVHEFDGTVLRLMGDGALVVWNAPNDQANHQELACRAALRIQERLDSMLNTRVGVPFHTRIGLHFGTASVGNYGSTERVDYSVIGSNVNLASRIEQLNKHLGTKILVTESVFAEAEDSVNARPLGWFRVKGLDKVVEVYELLSERKEDTQLQWVESFLDGLHHFRNREWEAARDCFQATLDARPGDKPAKFYLREIAGFVEQPPPADWMGEVAMDEK